MTPERVRDAASIVLIGSLNPAIFHPAWFASRSLIQKTEEEGAVIEHVTPQISTFTAGWLTLQVVQNRFMASTEEADSFPVLRDLAVGTFQLLEHTPAKQIGMNRELTFDLVSEDQWHHVGHVLVPKAIWRRHTKDPGMKFLTIHCARQDDLRGEVNVTVRPAMSRMRKFCIQFEVNSHFQLEDGAIGGDAVKVFATQFDKAMTDAEELVLGVLGDAIAEKGQ